MRRLLQRRVRAHRSSGAVRERRARSDAERIGARVTATVTGLLTRGRDAGRLTTVRRRHDAAAVHRAAAYRSTPRTWRRRSPARALSIAPAGRRRPPRFAGQGSGAVALIDTGPTDFAYDLTHVNLARAADAHRYRARRATARDQGAGSSGPSTALRATGDATLTDLTASDVSAGTLTGHYDARCSIRRRPRAPRPPSTTSTRRRSPSSVSRCRRCRARSPSTPRRVCRVDLQIAKGRCAARFAGQARR